MSRELLIALVAVFLFTAFGCQSTKANPDQAKAIPPEVQQLRRLLALSLERAVRAGTYQSTTRNESHSPAIQAFATFDPDAALAKFGALPRSDEDARAVFEQTAFLLATVLQGDHQSKLIRLCRGLDEAEVQIAFGLRTDSPELLTELVDPKLPEGNIALLLHAVERKHTNRPWKDFAKAASCQADAGSDGKAVIDFLKAWLYTPDSLPIKSIKAFAVGNRESPIAEYLRVLSQRGNDGLGVSRRLCSDLATEARKLKLQKQAFLLGQLCFPHRDNAPKELLNSIKSKALLDYLPSRLGPRFSLEYPVSFYIARTLVGCGAREGVTLCEKLAEGVLSFGQTESYYHMLSTIAGVVARLDPEKASEIARNVKSLSWAIHAKRCVLRAWAEHDRTLNKATVHEMTPLEQHWPELLVEVAVGRSFIDPRAAVEILRQIPKQPSRHVLGACLIAPSLARLDLKETLELLDLDGRSTFTHTDTYALSRIVLDQYYGKTGPVSTRSEFHPSFARCRDFWPGPHLPPPPQLNAKSKREQAETD